MSQELQRPHRKVMLLPRPRCRRQHNQVGRNWVGHNQAGRLELWVRQLLRLVRQLSRHLLRSRNLQRNQRRRCRPDSRVCRSHRVG
jgi:hypothetical protein